MRAVFRLGDVGQSRLFPRICGNQLNRKAHFDTGPVDLKDTY